MFSSYVLSEQAAFFWNLWSWSLVFYVEKVFDGMNPDDSLEWRSFLKHVPEFRTFQLLLLAWFFGWSFFYCSFAAVFANYLVDSDVLLIWFMKTQDVQLCYSVVTCMSTSKAFWLWSLLSCQVWRLSTIQLRVSILDISHSIKLITFYATLYLCVWRGNAVEISSKWCYLSYESHLVNLLWTWTHPCMPWSGQLSFGPHSVSCLYQVNFFCESPLEACFLHHNRDCCFWFFV